MKHCSKCGRDLDDDMFYENQYGNWCKDCKREYQREYQRKHQEKYWQYQLNTALRHLEKLKEKEQHNGSTV